MAVVSCPVTTLRGVPVITAPLEIDMASAERLRAVLAETAARGHATIVVDLSETAFCDTAGLQVLVLAHRRALAEGGQLRLVVRAATLLRLFSLTGVDQVIPSFRKRRPRPPDIGAWIVFIVIRHGSAIYHPSERMQLAVKRNRRNFGPHRRKRRFHRPGSLQRLTVKRIKNRPDPHQACEQKQSEYGLALSHGQTEYSHQRQILKLGIWTKVS